jgi:signal recognition particle subunit SRP54
MFKNLSDKLTALFKKINSRGTITEEDINNSMREIRIALLEADVALPIAKEFVNNVKEKAIGKEIVRSITPGQMIIKIVHDQLVETLGGKTQELNFNTNPPSVYLMVGLQGSGKTTSTAKLASFIKKNHSKKILVTSVDIYRPAAIKQLEKLAQDNQIDIYKSSADERPEDIAKAAKIFAQKNYYDILIIDTAGRLHIDELLMQELKNIVQITLPIEILLVTDSLTGQDAAKVAQEFKNHLAISGIILSRLDSDARGGAALSMRMITDCPIKFSGTGEKISEFEVFHPERIASRILDMGDIVSLVEKAAEIVDEEEALKLSEKIKRGEFDLNDLKEQIKTFKKMGGISSILGMLPGMGQLKSKLNDSNFDEKMIIRQEAIIDSMTKKERKYFKIIDGSRKRRIASGSGTTVQDVNILLKRYQESLKMMKKFSNMDQKSIMRSGLKNLLGNF